jgi:hypothetical protein
MHFLSRANLFSLTYIDLKSVDDGYRKTDGQQDDQANRLTNTVTDRQTEIRRQMERQRETLMDKQTEQGRQMERWTDIRMDKQTEKGRGMERRTESR